MQIFSALRKYPRFQHVKLIMAGKSWTSEMRRYRESSGMSDKIIECVEVSNEGLQALYSGAMSLLFPSLEEGGLGGRSSKRRYVDAQVIISNRPTYG